MDDRRTQPRIPMRAEAEVRFSSWEIFRLIYTINISQGGMNLEVLGDEPKVGTKLSVKLSLPSGPAIELEAVVKHVVVTTSTRPQPPNAPPPPKKCQVGVQFQNLDPIKKALIEQTIRAHAGGMNPVSLTRKKD